MHRFVDMIVKRERESEVWKEIERGKEIEKPYPTFCRCR